MIARIGAFIVGAVLLTPVWLDGSEYEGFTPERDDLAVMATILAVAAGLLLGWANRDRRWYRVLVGAVAGSVVHAGVTVLVYRFVIPLDFPIPPALLVPLPVVAAMVGFGAGLLVRRPVGGPSQIQGYALAFVIVLVGVYAVTGFVRVGAEWATARFQPGDTSDATSLDLGAGRHAVFATYNDQPGACTIKSGDGAVLKVRQPSVEFTDNSDSIVTVLFGVFDLSAPGRVAVDCPRGRIGRPPEVRGPLGHLLFVPIALLCLIGAIPGLVYGVARFRGR